MSDELLKIADKVWINPSQITLVRIFPPPKVETIVVRLACGEEIDMTGDLAEKFKGWLMSNYPEELWENTND